MAVSAIALSEFNGFSASVGGASVMFLLSVVMLGYMPLIKAKNKAAWHNAGLKASQIVMQPVLETVRVAPFDDGTPNER